MAGPLASMQAQARCHCVLCCRHVQEVRGGLLAQAGLPKQAQMCNGIQAAASARQRRLKAVMSRQAATHIMHTQQKRGRAHTVPSLSGCVAVLPRKQTYTCAIERPRVASSMAHNRGPPGCPGKVSKPPEPRAPNCDTAVLSERNAPRTSSYAHAVKAG